VDACARRSAGGIGVWGRSRRSAARSSSLHGGGARGVEGHVNFDFLHDLMDAAVQHRGGPKAT